MSDLQRDVMEVDVLIVGAGPAGLSAAIRLKQVSPELSVVVLEKGSEVGAHILSGAVMDPIALNELFPDWKERGAPLDTAVTRDKFLVLGPAGSLDITWLPMPGYMKNHGNYIISLGQFCRWLAGQAEALGVEIYPGFAAAAPLYDEMGALKGVQTGDMGIGRDGAPKADFTPGMEIHAKYTLIAEGVRGSVAKQVISRFALDADSQPQKYGIGLKELWQVPADQHQKGLTQHTFGWPLNNSTGGGSFMYHFGDRHVAIGFVLHLNYANPWLSPFDEFQRFKTHPDIRKVLEGGKRLTYGARAISEGGWQSVPKLAFPGGCLIGCSAGFVNVPRIKGSHNAMKTGMLAAESVARAVGQGRQRDEVGEYQAAYEASWVWRDLKGVRNVKPLWSRLGTLLGVGLGGLEMWMTSLLPGQASIFGTLKHAKTDAASTKPAKGFKKIDYPKPDGVISFDKPSSVFLSGTNHEENQPIHLQVKDLALQASSELAVYGGLSARYCPAGVYEWVEDGAGQRYQINAQNCVHCKTCDIKDPNQNINWVPPQGSEGPVYPMM